MKKDPRVYLQDILEAIQRIRSYRGLSRENFFTDFLLQDGVIRQISVIGEASSKLSAEVKDRHSEIPWKKIIGMRNIVVHDYSQIKLDRVWETVEEDLPELSKAVQEVIQELEG
ncbi:MAG: DUF86 domain-containing protein [Candidatus Peribacteraceae bacterium]|nr:DUF86 domain-containing protein [Candidatus Peribacteraceae bacterium]